MVEQKKEKDIALSTWVTNDVRLASVAKVGHYCGLSTWSAYYGEQTYDGFFCVWCDIWSVHLIDLVIDILTGILDVLILVFFLVIDLIGLIAKM